MDTKRHADGTPRTPTPSAVLTGWRWAFAAGFLVAFLSNFLCFATFISYHFFLMETGGTTASIARTEEIHDHAVKRYVTVRQKRAYDFLNSSVSLIGPFALGGMFAIQFLWPRWERSQGIGGREHGGISV